MMNERRPLKDLPKVYGYIPFLDDDPYILYDSGMTDDNGDPIYLDEDGEKSVRNVVICNSYKEVRRHYYEDVNKIKSLKSFIQSYQCNYEGEDKFLPSDCGKETVADIICKAKEKNLDKYRRAYNALNTGFFDVGETLYLMKDVVSIKINREEENSEAPLSVTLSLVNPHREVKVEDETDVGLVILLFGASSIVRKR